MNIITRVFAIRIANIELQKVKSIKLKYNSPLVLVDKPSLVSGVQNMFPEVIEGEIKCLDYTSLKTCLYETIINTLGNFAIDPITQEKSVITLGFDVYVKDHLGNIFKFTFSNVRIKTIQQMVPEGDSKEIPWLISFNADHIDIDFSLGIVLDMALIYHDDIGIWLDQFDGFTDPYIIWFDKMPSYTIMTGGI